MTRLFKKFSLAFALALAGTTSFSCSSEEDPVSDDLSGDGDGDGGGEGGEGDGGDGDEQAAGGTGGASGGEGGAPDMGGNDSGGELPDGADCRVVATATCELTSCSVPLTNGTHVSQCSSLTHNSNPPTSGPHYGSWAAFEKYEEPVPRGYWIHSLEHSAVVFTYNCEKADAVGVSCADLIDEISAFFDEWQADPLCTSTKHRLLLTPDPELDVPFAASAWGYFLKGNCFDAEAISRFIEDHYGMNYENICAPGIDPSSPTYSCSN